MKNWFLILVSATLVGSMTFAKETHVDAASSASTESEQKSQADAKTQEESEPVLGANAQASTATQKESEIPLKLEQQKVESSSESLSHRFIITLGVILVLGGGALFFLKKYARPRTSQSQMQIKVLTQHYLGPKKSLAVIRVAGESILIGVTDHSINAIKTLSLMDDELPTDIPKEFAVTDQPEVEEEFTMSGIQNMVKEKLKGMRSLS